MFVTVDVWRRHRERSMVKPSAAVGGLGAVVVAMDKVLNGAMPKASDCESGVGARIAKGESKVGDL
jgi:hypothetical protein